MRIDKVINNNVVSVIDENGMEIILTGKGIGFQKKSKDPVNETKIEKLFRPENKKDTYKLEELFKDTPIEVIQTSVECVEYAKQLLSKELNSSLYVTLIDHINVALERNKEGRNIGNRLLWDIQYFYPEEYQIGRYVLSQIQKKLSISLPEDEAGFITMHFVNAEIGENRADTMNLAKFMQDVFGMITEFYHIEMEPESDQYVRFVAHLKYLGQKVLEGIPDPMEDDDQEFHEMIRMKYNDAYQCVIEIEAFIEKEYHFLLSPDEEMYLVIYVKRIIMDLQNRKEEK